MDLMLTKPDELVALLCTRLRQERLSLRMTQAEVAARAGISVGTLSNLEAGRSVAFESVVRVCSVLGRMDELLELFKPKLETLDDFVRYEAAASSQRIKRKKAHD